MTATQPKQDAPFTFTLPTVLDATTGGGDWPPEYLGSAAAQVAGREALEQARQIGERIAKNPDLTDGGKRRQYTKEVTPLLEKLKTHDAALQAEQQAAAQAVAALDAPDSDAKLTPAQLDRRLAIANRCGTLTGTERTEWLREAMAGLAPAKLDALAHEDTAITGIAPEQQVRLKAILQAARVDPARAEVVARHQQLVTDVAKWYRRRVDAITAPADLAALQEAKVIGLRRHLMTDAEKSAYIAKHQINAFLSLPA
jgi:hypothetical protein